MHCLLGIVLTEAGRTAEAVSAFEVCSELDPQNSTIVTGVLLLHRIIVSPNRFAR